MMDDLTIIDNQYSTTRLVTTEKPENSNKPVALFESKLFLPEGEKRKGEGGLRTRGYFKKSYTDKPLITVITVVFNGEAYLEEAIQSVINQSYDNIEYIIIDGGSSDDTLNIIKKYEDRIDYWISSRDEGIYDAMNKGIMLSSGEVIGIMNSDDWYEKNTTQLVASKFNSDEQLCLVYGMMNIINSDGSINSTYGSKEAVMEIFATPFSHPTCFFRKKTYQDLGLFDKQFSTAADYDFMLRFIKSKLKYCYIDELLSNFRKVGVTSQSVMFPAGQIWCVLRKNNYKWYMCLAAVVFRSIRVAATICITYVGGAKLRKKIRTYLSYHVTKGE